MRLMSSRSKRSDIKQAGLINEEGVYVGEWTNGQRSTRFATMDRSMFCVMRRRAAAKASGWLCRPCSHGRIAPLSPTSKREIFELTSGWRGTEGNNRILRFEPASSTHSVAFNPLDEIRMGTDHETGDMQNLATLIVDPDGKGLHTH